jgi:ubiquinone/menaquinone biosynthesis C-methylase UbiE
MTIVVIRPAGSAGQFEEGDAVNATEMAATFNPTHDDYARIAPALWDLAGAATVRRTAPAPGERVLDACCGIGSSALPAAHAVAPNGSVDAVDIADKLLAKGRTTAQRLGLDNIHFTEADVTTWKPDEPPYDLIQCVFGVFLLPDLDRDTTHLINLLRDGGRLAVTIWAKGALEPFSRTLYEIVTRHRPELANRPHFGAAIERINTEPLLHAWLNSLGLRDITIHTHPHTLHLTPETAWNLVTGTGFRGLLTGLDPTTIQTVHTELLTTLTERRIHTETTSALIAIGHT